MRTQITSLQAIQSQSMTRSNELRSRYISMEVKNNPEFVYFAPGSRKENIDYEHLNVSYSDNSLSVENAEIWHFSRYGFTVD